MKINILKENLAKGLGIVERISGKNLTLPILNNVFLSAEENTLKLCTTDLEIGINYWCLAKIESKGQFTVPVKTFTGLVSLLEEEKLQLEKKENSLLLKSENHKSQIKGMEPKDFPIIPEVSKNNWVEFYGPDLSQAILQVIDFSALTQIRPELSGIYFSINKKQAKIVATDSFRLAEKTVALSENTETQNSFILPRNTARELVNIFSQDGKIKFYIAGGQLMVEKMFPETKNPQAQLVSRLIEGNYPNYQEVIPKEFKTQVILNKEKFLNHIKTASLFSGKSSEVSLSVGPKKDSLTVFSQSADTGESKSSLAAKIKGEATETSFNYRFLSEGLNQIRSEEVVFELNGQEGPGVLKPLDNPDYIHVIMPVKSG